jgi:hypothetical protein
MPAIPPSLEKLEICHSSMIDDDGAADAFLSLPNLTQITIGCLHDVTFTDWSNFAGLASQLKSLECSQIKMNGSGAKVLSTMENLQVLALTSNDWVSDDTLKAVSSLPRLHALSLYWCDGITSRGLGQLAYGPASVTLRGVRAAHCANLDCERLSLFFASKLERVEFAETCE